jgi:hypothetical protein
MTSDAGTRLTTLALSGRWVENEVDLDLVEGKFTGLAEWSETVLQHGVHAKEVLGPGRIRGSV